MPIGHSVLFPDASLVYGVNSVTLSDPAASSCCSGWPGSDARTSRGGRLAEWLLWLATALPLWAFSPLHPSLP